MAGNGTGDMFKRKRKKLKMEPLRRGKEEKSLAPTSVGRVCTLGLEVKLILQRLKILSLNY